MQIDRLRSEDDSVLRLFPSRFTKSQLRPAEDQGEPPEKSCTKCGEFLPADREFFYTVKRANGYTLTSECKCCILERLRRRSEANPYQWQMEITRRRRAGGTLVVVTYRG